MKELIDFTNAKEELNSYKGSEKKKTLIYNNKKYLVKFPDPVREKNKNISYVNNAFSEYIGSNIFKLLGFNTQNTILGIYIYNSKEKIVCACEDFTDNEKTLYEFENLVLSFNPDKKIDTDINDIMSILNESSTLINLEDTIHNFWNIFIIDALIGNTDRHNGNWGFLKSKEKIEFAPIYDCGSCLNPMLNEEEIEKISDKEIKNLALNTYSCLKEDNKKINYFEYITSLKNEYCNKSLLEIYPKINLEKIEKLIEDIPMSDVRKKFYKDIINKRYEEILKVAYNKLKNKN